MFFTRKKRIPLTDFFTNDFVDIHSHLLPGIDDGAKDVEDSVSLIQTMRSYGIKNFITTPHVLGDVYPNTPEIIKGKLSELHEVLKNRGMEDVSISAAAEYMLDEQFAQTLKEGEMEMMTYSADNNT